MTRCTMYGLHAVSGFKKASVFDIFEVVCPEGHELQGKTLKMVDSTGVFVSEDENASQQPKIHDRNTTFKQTDSVTQKGRWS